jgi:hypothetical protein
MEGGARSGAEQPPVLIYRDHLLRYSEIWVRSQGEALRGFRAHYAGSKRRSDVEMPRDRTFLVNDGGPAGRAAEVSRRLWSMRISESMGFLWLRLPGRSASRLS